MAHYLDAKLGYEANNNQGLNPHIIASFVCFRIRPETLAGYEVFVMSNLTSVSKVICGKNVGKWYMFWLSSAKVPNLNLPSIIYSWLALVLWIANQR